MRKRWSARLVAIASPAGRFAFIAFRSRFVALDVANSRVRYEYSRLGRRAEGRHGDRTTILGGELGEEKSRSDMT